jgi:hypothetical protein
VSVRFTQAQEVVYRAWFLCSQCAFQTRAQNSERPPYCPEELIFPASSPDRAAQRRSSILDEIVFEHRVLQADAERAKPAQIHVLE